MILLNDTSHLHSEDHIILVKDQQLYVGEQPLWQLQTVGDIDQQLLMDATYIPLGSIAGSACYVAELYADIAVESLVTLRSQLSLLSQTHYHLASRALQLLTWYKQHQFCGQCGNKTRAHAVDMALFCESCELSYYPKISPCMMCLIVRGDDCLLAHHHRQPEGVYSTLAGFVEAGESVEQTVHREVFEEVGLQVDNLTYFSSQSWPFPHQLMLAYFAEYKAGDIKIDDVEIVDAHWFRYDNLPTVPPITTLSGQLIQAFVTQRIAAANA